MSGIPTLVFIDGETGKLISANGRKIVTDDPKGEQFPWKCKPLQESLGSSFINTSGEEVPMESLEGKIIGLYFSAHWVRSLSLFLSLSLSPFRAITTCKLFTSH